MCRQEWHFFCHSHGKGPCDGLGGTVKRLATKASETFSWSDTIMQEPAISFNYCNILFWQLKVKHDTLHFAINPQLITNSPLIMQSWVLGGLPYPSVHLLFSYCTVNLSYGEKRPQMLWFVYTKVQNFEPTQFKSGLIWGMQYQSRMYWTMTSSSG